jgi:peptidoglycan/LPS O-acetylase OafA/YrhL
MLPRSRSSYLLALAAAGGAFAVCTIWLISTRGAPGPLLVLPFVLSGLALITLAHLVAHRHDVRTRYHLRHRPLAGPRPGARLPG